LRVPERRSETRVLEIDIGVCVIGSFKTAVTLTLLLPFLLI
jgi:hypothetical protein